MSSLNIVKYGILAAALAIAPAFAQGTTPNGNTPAGNAYAAPDPAATSPYTNPGQNPNPNYGDHTAHNFGWVGLVGLAGLLGLARRNRDRNYTEDVNRSPLPGDRP